MMRGQLPVSTRSTPIGVVLDLGGSSSGAETPLDSLGSAPPPNAPQRKPAVGDVIDGKYRLDREIGAGGMGVVFGGRHLLLDTPIAIKCLRPELTGEPSALRRFLQEARIAASISHEHSTRIYDVGTTSAGVPFIVMEYLEGRSLEEHLERQGPLTVGTALSVVLQALSVLAEAHAKGLVHRDLKPGNLFLQDRTDGALWVKVMDFGISKPIGAEPQVTPLTEPRSLLGSPQYMSPEQLRDASSVDHRSDIWSMGVVLYELLVGVPPFDAPSLAELCAEILASPPPSLRQARGDVPPGLDEAVRSLLAKDPAARPQTVGDVARLLAPFAPENARAAVVRIDAVVQGAEPSGSEPQRIVVSRAPPPRGRSRRSTAIGLALVAGASAVAYAVATPRQPRPEPGAALPAPISAEVAPIAPASLVAAPNGLDAAPSRSAAVAEPAADVARPAASSAPLPPRRSPTPPARSSPSAPRIRLPSQIQPVE